MYLFEKLLNTLAMCTIHVTDHDLFIFYVNLFALCLKSGKKRHRQLSLTKVPVACLPYILYILYKVYNSAAIR